MAAGHSGQFTPMRLPVNTVTHTTLVGLKPATFRRATSSAIEMNCSVYVGYKYMFETSTQILLCQSTDETHDESGFYSRSDFLEISKFLKRRSNKNRPYP